jgi:hypothetical protein
MINKSKISRIIKSALKKRDFENLNDNLNTHLLNYENGWSKIIFSFGRYDTININLLRRINQVDSIWDQFSTIITSNFPKEGFFIQTHIPIIAQHCEEFHNDLDPLGNLDEILKNPDKLEEAFSFGLDNAILPFLEKVNEISYLDELINKPTDKYESLYKILSGGTHVLFKKVLVSQLNNSENKDEVESFVRDLFEEKLNVKGSKPTFQLFNKTLDDLISISSEISKNEEV